MPRIWSIFCQGVTLTLAVLFTLAVLRPEWLPTRLLPTSGITAPSSHGNPAGAGGATPAREVADATSSVAHRQPILSYANAARRAIPAVVNIVSDDAERQPRRRSLDGGPMFRRPPDGREGLGDRGTSLGSGVIVSGDGLVLTNQHVIDAARVAEVLLADGRRLTATLVGSDPDTDLALLRVGADDLPAIEFADSDAASVGDVVLAIGNPFGVGQTVTMGIVSATGRDRLGINTFENFIQTDAAINPGNSGGALVDAEGRLLGINTAIYSRTGGSLGIGFAIPANSARLVVEQLAAHGRVVRGFIGVEPRDLGDDFAMASRQARASGALIAGVLDGGPADRAGVEVGDILIAIEGHEVTGTGSMLNLVASLKPGSRAGFRFLRDGREIELPIVVGSRPDRIR